MTIAKRIFFFLMVNFLVMASLIAMLFIAQIFFPEIFANTYGSFIIISLVFGFGGSFISLWLSKFIVKRTLNIQMISENERSPEYRWLMETTHRLAKKAGLNKMPEVGVYDSPELNAFATGSSKNNALVAVSTGLLRSMNKSEAEGVLGHEVAHVANGDMVTMALVQGVVNAIVIFFTHIIMNIIENALRDENGGRSGLGFFMGMIVYQLIYSLLAFAAMPLVAFVSRMREYRADAGGATLAGREKMIQSLKKLQSYTHQVDVSHQSLATLKISNKPSSGSLLRFWSTHPPLKERIQRLERGGFRAGYGLTS